VEVETIVFDIEWGIDDWCCYASAYEQWCDLKWINATSGERHNSFNSFHGEAILKKIPNQNYIIATYLPVWPSGIIVIDAKTKEIFVQI
jgi:hypothetical protein